MKKAFSFIFLTALVSSCSSVTHLKTKPACAVWKTQKYMGAYSIEVADKKVQWTGECKGGHWKCKEIVVSYDENSDVFLNNTINVGKVESATFNGKGSDIPFSRLEVDSKENVVKTPNDVFYYNQKCTVNDAVIGAIALGLISEAQKK